MKGIGDIVFLDTNPKGLPAQHNCVIKTSRRDNLNKILKEKNIATGVHYYPNHLYEMYKPYYRELPVTENVWKNILTLPLYPDLSDEDFQLIINEIKRTYNT